jgi:hypothetical protein
MKSRKVRMAMDAQGAGDRYTVRVGGDVSGQLAAGKDIHQVSVTHEPQAGATAADLAEVRRLVDELKQKVVAEAPPEQRDAALERVDELQEAVVAEEPDVTTMDYVRRWFGKNLPKLAGAVTGLIVHPLVGRVVEAAGDLAASEFRRRFGGEGSES